MVIEVRSGTTWHHQATLTDPNPGIGPGFGGSVAIADTSRRGAATLLVGDPAADKGAGAAYVYMRANGTWHRQATLTDPSGSPIDSFGYAVALSGNTALISAPGAGDYQGAAYVYVRSGKSWVLQATLTDPNQAANASFGLIIALSGATAVADDTAGSARVYIFVRSGATWHQQATLHPGPGAAFVTDFDIAGPTLVVGTPGDNFQSAGAAYVYVRSGNSWRRQARLADPQRQAQMDFGWAVAVSNTVTGMRLLVGNPNAGANHCGKAYDFVRSAARWRAKAIIVNPDCERDLANASGSSFGRAMSLRGRNALIGAPDTPKVGAWYYLHIP